MKSDRTEDNISKNIVKNYVRMSLAYNDRLNNYKSGFNGLLMKKTSFVVLKPGVVYYINDCSAC